MSYSRLMTIALLPLWIGCGENNASVNVTAEEVVLAAKVVRYEELSDSEREAIGNYCCSYSRTGGWASSDLERFEPQEGYFVRATINAEALAQLSLLHSCGSSTYVDTCSPEELSSKVSEILGDSNPHRLYGKYMNSWVFLGPSGVVPSTEKFDGFRLLAIEQDRSPRRDNVLIGPLPMEPTQMRIQLHHNLTEQKQVVAGPEVSLGS